MTRWSFLPEYLEEKVVDCSKKQSTTTKKRSKYKNITCEVDGIKFSSVLEARYYKNLVLLKKAGEVLEFKLQVPFELQPAYIKSDGKKIRSIKYLADFVIKYKDGHEEVVDTKGMETAVYKLKKKMLLFKYPQINFKEVRSNE